ncbi:hypothetical protein GCM10010230_56910 [Streptomyces narbonensis]|nr:hypothetical protein GCM10010230_56910 [Streptomyces narbonensis]
MVVFLLVMRGLTAPDGESGYGKGPAGRRGLVCGVSARQGAGPARKALRAASDRKTLAVSG